MAMPPIVVVADLFARRGVEADRVRSEQYRIERPDYLTAPAAARARRTRR